MNTTAKAAVLAALGALALEAKVELGVPFTDRVVLQRGREVPVWGKADPGAKVKVTLAGATFKQIRETTAGKDGAWCVKLGAMDASCESRTLTAETCAGEAASAKDVLVGEVWFCAGQSNTELPLCGGNPHFRDAKGAMRAQITRKPLVRFCFQSDYKTSVEPKKTAALPVEWKTFTPENLNGGRSFSAMGVYFALEIHNALGIPVGIVGTYWGGTKVEPWTPKSGFDSVAGLGEFATRALLDPAAYKAKKDAGEIKFRIQDQPRVLWNEMVEPWTPFAIRGFIWYQGCSNAGDGHAYAPKMQALYNGWAKEFKNPGLKLYFVQLAPWGYADIATIQEGQAIFAAAEKNAGMAVINDRGNLSDIHPNDKETVGQRLALLALKRDYGFDNIKADSPTLKNWRIDGDKFILAFNDVESWYLYNDDWTTTSGFELAGEDGKFVPAKIENLVIKDKQPYKSGGVIKGKELIVRAEGVASPKKLRYLFSRPWYGALHNEVDLPLGAFHIGN